MPAPTIPTPLDALLLALREAIAPALAAALTGCDPGPLTPSEGAAYDRGVEDGRVRGRAAMAADVAALLDAAARPGAEDSEEVGHG